MTSEEEDETRPLRWGIMGAARIARRRLAPAIAATGGQVVAVAASDGARAEEFAEALGIPRAYEGYARLLEDEEVEAVYVPLANGLHYEWAVKTAESGRPCLCEKPMALNAREAAEIAEAFDSAGRVVQEAFMWRHHAQIAAAADQIAAGAIGAIQQVNATFSFTLDRPEDYRWKADQGGGALWDIGAYCVNAARYFFAGEPIAASARSLMTSGADGVDVSTAGWLDFGEGRLSTISCSFCSAFSQGLELVGAEGRMWLGQPWGAPERPGRLLIERGGEKKVHEFESMNAYEAMVRHFTRVVREPGRPMAPAENGLAQAIAMDGLQSSARGGGAVWSAPSTT